MAGVADCGDAVASAVLWKRLRTGTVDNGSTWGCGYAAPTPRMQYTSSSFAQMLVDLFGLGAAPANPSAGHLPLFPQQARFHSEVPDPVLDEVSAHVSFGAWLFSWFRVFQQGSIQTYLLYIFFALIVLLSGAESISKPPGLPRWSTSSRHERTAWKRPSQRGPRRRGARLAAAAAGRHRQDQGAVRRPGRAAGVAAVLRPHQALPERLGLQHHDDLGVPGRAGGRSGDGGARLAADPAGQLPAPISFTGDLILLAYLLGLGRFFTASAALDTGSAFEGMGAAREVTFACLAEPAFFLGLLVLAKLSGSLKLGEMLGGSLARHWLTAGASLALVLLKASEHTTALSRAAVSACKSLL